MSSTEKYFTVYRVSESRVEFVEWILEKSRRFIKESINDNKKHPIDSTSQQLSNYLATYKDIISVIWERYQKDKIYALGEVNNDVNRELGELLIAINRLYVTHKDPRLNIKQQWKADFVSFDSYQHQKMHDENRRRIINAMYNTSVTARLPDLPEFARPQQAQPQEKISNYKLSTIGGIIKCDNFLNSQMKLIVNPAVPQHPVRLVARNKSVLLNH